MLTQQNSVDFGLVYVRKLRVGIRCVDLDSKKEVISNKIIKTYFLGSKVRALSYNGNKSRTAKQE